MRRSRRLLGLTLAAIACTSHERPQEPSTACPEGMLRIVGERGGARTIAEFCVDRGEVTTAAYANCVDAGGCSPALGGPGDRCNISDGSRGDDPINCVTFKQAIAYCARLGKRLPDADEWRLAVRGGDPARRYPWGREDVDATRACVARPPTAGTCRVGAHAAGASAAGVVDLVGNVAEWVTASGDPSRAWGPVGGSWMDATIPGIADADAPSSAREPGAAATLGFRCVVATFTPVQALDERAFVPYRPPQRELPRLAEPLSPPAPSRPLAHLGVLAHVGDDAEARIWWPHLGGFEGLDAAAAARLGPAPPESIAAAVLPQALADLRPARSLGSLTLWTRGWSSSLGYVALERDSARVRWQRSFEAYGTSYVQAIAPRTLIASIYGAEADALVAFALDDGAEAWRIDGAEDGDIHRIRHLWAADERAYVVGDRGLAAIDATTGAIVWAEVAVADGCGVVAGADLLVIEEASGGHRKIDAATGAELGRIAKSSSGACRWGKSEYDGGVAAAVIEGGRLFLLDAPGRRGATLRALDLAGAGEVWRAEGLAQGVLLADQDAVYVARGVEHLVAIDAASGRAQVELSLGGAYEAQLALGGGPAAPLLVVTSDQSGAWILGRGPAPTIAEDYVITGRLVVDDGGSPRRAAGVRVRVGDRVVRTGRDGRFRARGRLIGGVAIVPGDTRDPYELVEGGGRIFRFDAAHVVLDGRGAYDVGDLVLYEWTAA